jgi:GNAT superfamily N-acetyltransferase
VQKTFEALARVHDRAGFDCGVAELNVFLRQHARRQQERGVSRSFALVEDGGAEPQKRILGFFTLVAAQIDAAEISLEQARRLPNKIPCVLLARLAVSVAHQGQGIGKLLLVEAANRVTSIAGELGVAGLFVEAKDEAASRFYQHFGFTPFPSNSLKLFQPLSGLRGNF